MTHLLPNHINLAEEVAQQALNQPDLVLRYDQPFPRRSLNVSMTLRAILAPTIMEATSRRKFVNIAGKPDVQDVKAVIAQSLRMLQVTQTNRYSHHQRGLRVHPQWLCS
jgi:hypothetical protein